MRAIVLSLLLIAAAMAGCTDDTPDSADAPSGTDGGSSGISEPEPAPEPVYVRETLFSSDLTTTRGTPGRVACDEFPPGGFVDYTTGTNTNDGGDYDSVDVSVEHAGLNYTFVNTAEVETNFVILLEGNPLDGHRHYLQPGEEYTGVLPDSFDAAGMTSCTEAGTTGTVEIWDTVLES